MIKVNDLISCSLQVLGIKDKYKYCNQKVMIIKGLYLLENEGKELLKEKIKSLNINNFYLSYFIDKFSDLYKKQYLKTQELDKSEINSLALISIWLIKKNLDENTNEKLIKFLISEEELRLKNLKQKILEL